VSEEVGYRILDTRLNISEMSSSIQNHVSGIYPVILSNVVILKNDIR